MSVRTRGNLRENKSNANTQALKLRSNSLKNTKHQIDKKIQNTNFISIDQDENSNDGKSNENIPKNRPISPKKDLNAAKYFNQAKKCEKESKSVTTQTDISNVGIDKLLDDTLLNENPKNVEFWKKSSKKFEKELSCLTTKFDKLQIEFNVKNDILDKTIQANKFLKMENENLILKCDENEKQLLELVEHIEGGENKEQNSSLNEHDLESTLLGIEQSEIENEEDSESWSIFDKKGLETEEVSQPEEGPSCSSVDLEKVRKDEE